MAEQFYSIVTKIGQAKIANATALGNQVSIVKFQVGDGNGSYYSPTEDQTSLKNKLWEGNISSITVDSDNPNWIVIETVIPGTDGGFMVREAGIADNEGNLIAIGKYPETYKPVAGDGSIKDLVMKMLIEVTNASSVSLKIDPTAILATRKEVLYLKKEVDKNTEAIKKISTTAEGTSFDNSKNGMTATNVQDAIEENKSSILEIKKEINGQTAKAISMHNRLDKVF